MVDRPNIVLLTIDALRADHLSCYGYERNTSPFIDSLASDSLLFENAYSVSSHTREAVPALLTGDHPGKFAAAGYQLSEESVASTLDMVGYRTAAFHSNPFLSRGYGFDEGFDRFDDGLYFGKHRLIALAQRLMDKIRGRHYSRASKINEKACNWLRETRTSEEPFFLWNHYMDVHGPYQPPDSTPRRFWSEPVSDDQAQNLYRKSVDRPEDVTPEEQQLQLDLYDGEISYLDEQIAKLFDWFKQNRLLDNSYVILTSDHGDAFGEHGYYGHPRRLDCGLTSVPLLVLGPDISSARLDVPVSLFDIAPTIRDLGGLEYDSFGESLRDIWTEPENYSQRVVFAEATGMNADERRYVIRDAKDECYVTSDLSSSEYQIKDCSNDILREKLLEYINIVEDGIGESEIDEWDGESTAGHVEERLEALGYK
jgi:arylsulfatase